MKKQKNGKIVNVISVDGFEGKAERSVYGSSKWAIAGFTESLRKELEKYNISVVGLYPGVMKTNLFKNAGVVDRDLQKAMDPKEVAKIVEFSINTDSICLEKIVFRSLHS